MTFIWIWIAALIIEVLLLDTVGFMMMGIIFWTFTAVFIWCLLKGFAADRTAVWVCTIYTAVAGLLIILSDTIQNIVEVQFGIEVEVSVLVFGWSISGIFLLTGFYMGVIKNLKCTMKVKATCVGYQEQWGKHRTYYSPVFTYKLQNQCYRNSTGEIYTHRKIAKRFVIGQEYQIYANPKKPMMMCTKRTISGSSLLLLTLGVLFFVSIFRKACNV